LRPLSASFGHGWLADIHRSQQVRGRVVAPDPLLEADPMTTHAFKIGQYVQAKETPLCNMPHGVFSIVNLLPSTADGVPLYLIRRIPDGDERIVRQYEIELARSSPSDEPGRDGGMH
jgi:hypothetical protein